jgi:hypothetical protein
MLILGEFPSWNEMRQGRPFATDPKFPTAGRVLRKELARVGLDLMQFRVTNLWLHEPNKNEECFNAGRDAALDEAKGKQAILMVGSETVEFFTGYKVSDVTGLQVESGMLSAPLIFAMVNPALALHRSVGEVRLAITKFAKLLEESV